jgi:hypothetical protein
MFQAIATIYLRDGTRLLASGFGLSPSRARAAARAAAGARCASVKPERIARVRIEGC